jgi:hypothetical protein
MAQQTTKFVTVTYTIKGTPVIERYSTREQAEARVQEVQNKERVPVKML